MMKILGLQTDEPELAAPPSLMMAHSPPPSPTARSRVSQSPLARTAPVRSSMGGVRESLSATTPTRGSRTQHFASPSKLRVSMSMGAQGFDDVDVGAAKLAYSSTFTGLQSYGPSGMTVLDELTDMALTACEKGREAGQRHHARGAALLSQTGKIYTGCDVHVKDTGAGSSGVSAERACVLAAIADGESVFHCLVIASDTMKSLPTPDGQSREFLRSFGAFSVVLVNCVMENKQTSTQELFPLNSVPERPPTLTSSGAAGGGSSGSNVDDEDDEAALDVLSWDVERVKSWLADIGMPEVQSAFHAHRVDGRLLLQVDETFATETLDIHQAVRRRKLVRNVQRLKAAYTKDLQRKSIDELDDYVLMLESHRITLVAKLKAIFDRFDSEKEGRLSGAGVEQALLYMNRPVDSAAVNAWLLRLKDRGLKIEFPEFVSQYSALFAGMDPDVPVGETDFRRDEQRGASSPDRDRARGASSPTAASRRMSSRGAEGEERWYDDRSGRGRFGDEDDDRDDVDRRDRDRDRRRDVDDDLIDGAGQGQRQHSAAALEKDIHDIKVLAELKGTFDRFAVDGLMTPPETCQALTESGLVAPRREIAQYLKSRKHIGIARTITFFEFMRAFVAIRGPTKAQGRRSSSDSARTIKVAGALLREGDAVEAKYNGRGRWYTGVIKRINADDTVDLQYDDGEKDAGLSIDCVRPLEPKEDDRTKDRERERPSTASAAYRRVRDRDEPPPRDEERPRGSERDRPLRSSRGGFYVGDKVEGNYRGRGKWYRGKISRDRGDGLFDIDYDDGEKEMRVNEDLIRSPRPRDDAAADERRADRSRSRDTPRSDFRVGDAVECRIGGRWRPGKVTYVGRDGLDVRLTNGDTERDFPLESVRRSDDSPRDARRSTDDREESSTRRNILRDGDKVEARYRGRSKWYPGKISRDRGDGTFDIDYDDGEKETRVDKELIRLLAGSDRPSSPKRDSGRLEEGAKVEGNYRARGKWYPGKISRDRFDGTYDIDYDDGEKETRVAGALLRLR